MKRFHISIMVVLLIIMSSTAGSAKTYKIVTPQWVGWSPLNVAEVKGFWKESGIDVQVFPVPDDFKTATLFKTGQIDIVFGMIGTLVGYYMEGLPGIIIAETDWSHGGDKIITRKDLKPEMLMNKPVGSYLDNPAINFFLNQYITTLGIKLTDIKLTEMEPDSLARHFIAGFFDLIVCYDPEALRAEKEGGGIVAATSAAYPGSVPEGMMMTEESFSQSPKEDLIRIFKGWIKAVQWSQDPANWKEYVHILNTQTYKHFQNMGPFSENEFRELLSGVRIHDPKTMLERNQTGLYEYLKNLKMFLSSANMLKKDFDPEKIFNNSAVVESLSEWSK